MAGKRLLIYLLQRDLRVSDNPIFHHLATSSEHNFTHVLPVYIFPAHQIEISGFLKEGAQSPYPQARSQVGNYWRCGPHRARFIAQSVWDIKESLEKLNSGLLIRVGSPKDVVKDMITSLKEQDTTVSAVWMTEEKSYEEAQAQEGISAVCSDHTVDFKLWADEKYFVHDNDTGLDSAADLPDVFTSYRKSQEPLRERPRKPLSRPQKGSLPAFPESVPPQAAPFEAANSYEDLERRLLSPLDDLLKDPPAFPQGAVSAHPFKGGETSGLDRLTYLITSGAMTTYKQTRNGMLGPDFSTKLSAFLAQGCLSARKIHQELVDFEDGKNSKYEQAQGYGKGENEGTKGVRFELLWRDYMRLCMQKFGSQLFKLYGFQGPSYSKRWKTADKARAARDQKPSPEKLSDIIERYLEGTTGMGLIDASQRELYHTGYTSNRARQNVASFLAKHLGIDWRYGAEWYEMLLVDYDVSSNWSNWLYVAGVGNDPRGDARIFNPVKQAFDYDKEGKYVRMWLPEVKDLDKAENAFQPWTASQEDLERAGLANHKMVTDPIKRIDFSIDRKPRGPRRTNGRNKGRGGNNGHGGHGGKGEHGGGPGSGHSQGRSDGPGNPKGSKGPGAPNGYNESNGSRGASGHHGYHGAQGPKIQMANAAYGMNGAGSTNGYVVPIIYAAPPYGPQGHGPSPWQFPNQYPSRGRGAGYGYRGRGGRRGAGHSFNMYDHGYQQQHQHQQGYQMYPQSDFNAFNGQAQQHMDMGGHAFNGSYYPPYNHH